MKVFLDLNVVAGHEKAALLVLQTCANKTHLKLKGESHPRVS